MFAVWAALIAYLSSIPNLKSGFEADYFLRKCAHIFEYAVFTILLSRVFLRHNFGHVIKIAILSGGIAVLYAILDEYHQTYVAGRQGSLHDVAIDSVGIVLGLLAFHYLKFLSRTKK